MYKQEAALLSSCLFGLVDNHGVQVESLPSLLFNLLDDGAEVWVVLIVVLVCACVLLVVLLKGRTSSGLVCSFLGRSWCEMEH